MRWLRVRGEGAVGGVVVEGGVMVVLVVEGGGEGEGGPMSFPYGDKTVGEMLSRFDDDALQQ